MIVIGTAGHIDHGKSAIVQRLTGTDPDRLPEEKARGMTIDLGFAFFETATGESIAFVDVPGHERFVRNMIAGAGGVEVVMLVVAADDGWMPQSQEHFQIVRLLGVKQGMIVINKTDLVDPDWLELLREEIVEKVAGSFLDGAPVFEVSARTGEGFEALRQHLETLPDKLHGSSDLNKARLFIDRSFIRPGIGGVVTGTLRGGTFQLGQKVLIWPSQQQGKIRSLHSNNMEVKQVVPGQRMAVSFTGIDRDILQRGAIVSDRLDLNYFAELPVLALEVELIAEAPVSLVDRRRVLLIIGTTEAEGEVRLFGRKEIRPSERGIVFFKSDSPVYGLVGDRFIMRLPTPMVSLGGGKLLDHLAHFPRRKAISEYDYLQERLGESLGALIISELKKLVIVDRSGLLESAEVSRAAIESELEELVRQGVAGRFKDVTFLMERLILATEDVQAAMTKTLDNSPHLKGLSLEQLTALLPFSAEVTAVLVEYMVNEKKLIKVDEKYNLAGRGMALKGVIKQAHDEIMVALEAERFAPPTLAKIATTKIHKQAIKYILESGEGYKCGSEFIFLAEAWEEIVRFIRQHLREKDQLAVIDLREKFGFSRKFAIPVFEESDRIGLTKREGDVRVKGARFEKEDTAL